MARKRAPGRKPKGATAMRRQFTVRMPNDMRAELEAAARRRGPDHATSDELLWRLRASFAREYEERRDPAMRALTFLMSVAAEHIHMHMPLDWRHNPFLFRAFKLAVAKILDALEPSGEIQPPFGDLGERMRESDHAKGQWLIDTFKTPEAAAQSAADVVLRGLYSGGPAPQEWGPVFRNLENTHPEEFVRSVAGMLSDNIERTYYRMSDARRALTSKSKTKGG